MGARFERTCRALTVTRVARRSSIVRVLAEIGAVGNREASREQAQEFRHALEELGTTYIKLGQLLSSRPDLLPDVYIEELGHPVDEVPPVPFAQIDAVIRADLGDDVFVRIDPEPLPTASIAQTHRALTTTGQEVVIKVRRPGIVEQVELDLSVLQASAGLVAAHSSTAELFQVEALVEELDAHLHQELDFIEEAHNTEWIAGLIDGYDKLTVPRVIRPYVTERVMVLEWIGGSKVDAGHGLEPELAAELARCSGRSSARPASSKRRASLVCPSPNRRLTVHERIRARWRFVVRSDGDRDAVLQFGPPRCDGFHTEFCGPGNTPSRPGVGEFRVLRTPVRIVQARTSRPRLELRERDAALKSVSGSALATAPAFVIRGTEI